MSGCLQPYFYFGQGRCNRADSLVPGVKALTVVGDGKDIEKHLSIGVRDAASVVVFGHINTY
jgi:hypothetical protein